MKKGTLPLLICTLLSLFLFACAASFTTNAYRSLSVAKEFRHTALSSLADLYLKGLVDDEVKATSIRLGDEFAAAQILAVEALELYQLNKTEGAKLSAEAKLMQATKLYQRFVEFVTPYLEKKLNERSGFDGGKSGVKQRIAARAGYWRVDCHPWDTGGHSVDPNMESGRADTGRYSGVKGDETCGRVLRGAKRWMRAIAGKDTAIICCGPEWRLQEGRFMTGRA